jgi:hypothetical protein
MGESIDLICSRADTVFQQVTGIEFLVLKLNVFRRLGADLLSSVMCSVKWKIHNGSSWCAILSVAPTDSARLITILFAVTKDSTYYIFGRVNCPTYDDDSYWVKVDDGTFLNCNGLKTNGWEWMNLNSYPLTKGSHTLTIGYREDGACLDKICITNYMLASTGMGEADPSSVGANSDGSIDGYVLGQNYPNPFNPATTISFRVPTQSFVSLKVFDTLGREVSTLLSELLSAGTYTRQWDAAGLSTGVHFYRLQAGSFVETEAHYLR